MTVEELERFSERVAETRAARKQSYRDVERLTGISKANLHKIEHGGNPGLDAVIKLIRWIEGPA